MNAPEPPAAPLALIADNDPGVRGILREVLSRAGLRTHEAADGAEALARIQRGGIDLLVCDLDMPRLSGERLVAELERFAAAPPVIIVSGYLDDELSRQLGARRNVRAVLRKPFDVLRFGVLAAGVAREGRGASASIAAEVH